MNNNSWFKKEKPMVTLPGLGGGSASNLYWRPAGGGSGVSTSYVDDVFSNYNYTGKGKIGTNHAAICNGLNLGQKNFGKSVEFKYRTTQATDVGEALEIPYSSDFAVGTGDFTIEAFVRIGPNPDGYCTIFSQGWPFQVYYNQGTNKFESYFSNNANSGSYFLNGFNSTTTIGPGDSSWYHIAITRNGNTFRLFVNGSQENSATHSDNIPGATSSPAHIGKFGPSDSLKKWDGRISNLRFVKGQALYTSNFTPATAPLTTTSQGATASNVKLLCCNGDDPTDATVTPNPIVISDGSPFADNFGPFTPDVAGKGGMVWLKSRNNIGSYTNNCICDTERLDGSSRGKSLYTNLTDSQYDPGSDTNSIISSFNHDGFTVGGNANVASDGMNVMTWAFREASGFFDIKTWDGNSTAGRQISHGLNCVPGLVIVKSTNNSGDWMVYHRDIGATNRLKLNTPTYSNTTSSWNDTTPTKDYVTLGSNTGVNATGRSYVGYFFAGGESTETEAVSVDFDGTGDYLTVADSDDFSFGSGAFTIEAWVKPTTVSNKTWIAKWVSGQYEWFFGTNADELKFAYSTNGSGYTILDSGYNMQLDQWQHIAVTRDSSSKIRIFVNGIHRGATHNASATFHNGSQHLDIAHNSDGSSWQPTAKISNVRIVKGTAVYTTAFIPPTAPLTDITNTKLLCCNNSASPTNYTVTPGTITAYGNTTVSTESPFDHPDNFVFGPNQDQNIIKVGSYKGNGSVSSGPEIYCGWEPQYVMIKASSFESSTTTSWNIFDDLRGMRHNGGSTNMKSRIWADGNWGEDQNMGPEATPTGFTVRDNTNYTNANNQTYIFIAIRRSDGNVGRPQPAKKLFGMDYGGAQSQGESSSSLSGTTPVFDTQFAPDFRMYKQYDSTGPASWEDDWWISDKKLMPGNVKSNLPDNEVAGSWTYMDSSRGSGINWEPKYIGHLWKRNAGFDVVHYIGNGYSDRQIHHNLGSSNVPGMIWIKRMSGGSGNTGDWMVGHDGLHNGSTPWNYYLVLNKTQQEYNDFQPFGIPTTRYFVVGNSDRVNNNGDRYVAYLFSAVDGVSSIGHYTGTGGQLTINCGFVPRYIMVKKVSTSGNWAAHDSLRGYDTSASPYLNYAGTEEQYSGYDGVQPQTNAFSVNNWASSSGVRFIYYAHA